MSSRDKPSGSEDSQGDGGTTRSPDADELDVEGDWAAAREAAGWEEEGPVDRRARRQVPAPYLSPYLCLYAGFALGPPATLVVACLVSPRRLTVRRTAILVAIAGLAWCVAQGGTFLTGEPWEWGPLRMFRAGVNFFGGVAALLTWRMEDPTTFLWDRGVVVRSVGAGALLLAGLFAFSTRILLYLGW